MKPSLRVTLGVVFIVVAVGLFVISLTVRYESIGWFTLPGTLFLIIGGVLIRQALREPPVDLPLVGMPPNLVEAQRKFFLIFFRRSPKKLDAATLEAAARAAWQARFGPNVDCSRYVESGEAAVGYVVQAHGNAFMVLQTAKGQRTVSPPIHAEPKAAMEIWSLYSHELSVGVAYNYDTDARRLCALVASLGAALADEDTLGIYHVQSGRLWQVTGETLNHLLAHPESFFKS